MTVITTSDEMRRTVGSWHAAGDTVCLVPTMGSIHAGHLALIDAARQAARRVVVSIYVNPTQFAAGEDFASYPRNFQADQQAIDAAGGVDAIYAPQTMYGDDHATSIVPAGVAQPMEGASRPHFFTGVATIVFKLFQHVPANYAVFGEKDFQQLAVLRQMVADLDLPIHLIAHSTIREADGLALSSRNHYLSAGQRAIAPILYQTLGTCAGEISAGGAIGETLDAAKARLLAAGFDKIDYLDLRDAVHLATSTNASADDRLLVAAWLGETRLIDNCAIGGG
ncbi:MAG: pantoate--beta-alanine ligase [Alphaproteobacteria bacterium]|jgi:pantoate--beta-alanine ligase|nr:pantoate--beta-alanine ligase [Alphaproteobacteria bacterium]